MSATAFYLVIPGRLRLHRRRTRNRFCGPGKRQTDLLAPSMALALRAANGVRVCNPANAVGFRPQAARAAPEWRRFFADMGR